VRPLAEALAAASADQLLWGSDWPHPAIGSRMVNDGDLGQVLHDWFDAPLRQKVLVENPTRLDWADAGK
jgi:2-pyrone-4,6-dicarboxylate lactonase